MSPCIITAAWEFFGRIMLMLLMSEQCRPAYDLEFQGPGTAEASLARSCTTTPGTEQTVRIDYSDA